MIEEREEPGAEEMVGGTPHRLLDGYDGGGPVPPPEFIAEMLAGAPPEIRARAEEFAKQRATAPVDKDNATGQPAAE